MGMDEPFQFTLAMADQSIDPQQLYPSRRRRDPSSDKRKPDEGQPRRWKTSPPCRQRPVVRLKAGCSQEGQHRKSRTPERSKRGAQSLEACQIKADKEMAQKEQARHEENQPDTKPELGVFPKCGPLFTQETAGKREPGQGKEEEREHDQLAQNSAIGGIEPPDRRNARGRHHRHRMDHRNKRRFAGQYEAEPHKTGRRGVERRKAGGIMYEPLGWV